MNDPTANESVSWETTACPLCGAAQAARVGVVPDLLYGSPGEFTLVRCERCSHVFLNPRPTRECIGKFYPADYGPFRGGGGIANCKLQIANCELTDKRDARSHFDPRSWTWLRRWMLWWIDSRAAPIPNVGHVSNVPSTQGHVENVPHVNVLSPKRALELGCSHGAFLEQLRDRGWDCVGIEPAEAVARIARDRGFDVRVGSLESVTATDPDSFAPARFDAIFAWMVVEHLHDPLATLRLARELLAPGGQLLLSVPNFGCWERRAFGRYWYALQLPTHLQHFTSTSLRRLVESAGFELVELSHQRNVNNLVGSIGLWLRTRFPRWSIGERLIRWTDNPTALGLGVLAPLACALAAVRQAGRLTMIARNPVPMTKWTDAPNGTDGTEKPQQV